MRRSDSRSPPACIAARAALTDATIRARAFQSSGALKPGTGDGAVVLLVTRTDSSTRRWESAPSVAAELEAAGARVIYYSADGTINGGIAPLLDGLALFAAADVVIAAHGAALANTLVMRPGATLFEIVPKVCTTVLQ